MKQFVVAIVGREQLDKEFCQGPQDLNEFENFIPSWLCFLLMTTEGGARLERGDDLALYLPLLDNARALAEDNNQFGRGYYTAEIYYYLARLTEPDTESEFLCQIIQNHNRNLERHRRWAIYANNELDGRTCQISP
jgi:hypothetical protein